MLDGAKSSDIDALENGLLRTSYPAIRSALTAHLANEVKKCQIKTLAFPDSRVVNHCARYRVDGEVGRFEFETFDVRDTLGRIVFHGFDANPIRTGKQWHQTAGFKENAILRGVLDRSYRKTVIAFNIQRRQVKGGTPLNTLRTFPLTTSVSKSRNRIVSLRTRQSIWIRTTN
jgi:hypothetical protein